MLERKQSGSFWCFAGTHWRNHLHRFEERWTIPSQQLEGSKLEAVGHATFLPERGRGQCQDDPSDSNLGLQMGQSAEKLLQRHEAARRRHFDHHVQRTSRAEELNSRKVFASRFDWPAFHLHRLLDRPIDQWEFYCPIEALLYWHFEFFLVYDILTGKMVNGGIEGHKDIVRDVAWHPKRNEILTSSVSLANYDPWWRNKKFFLNFSGTTVSTSTHSRTSRQKRNDHVVVLCLRTTVTTMTWWTFRRLWEDRDALHKDLHPVQVLQHHAEVNELKIFAPSTLVKSVIKKNLFTFDFYEFCDGRVRRKGFNNKS